MILLIRSKLFIYLGSAITIIPISWLLVGWLFVIMCFSYIALMPMKRWVMVLSVASPYKVVLLGSAFYPVRIVTPIYPIRMTWSFSGIFISMLMLTCAVTSPITASFVSAVAIFGSLFSYGYTTFASAPLVRGVVVASVTLTVVFMGVLLFARGFAFLVCLFSCFSGHIGCTVLRGRRVYR